MKVLIENYRGIDIYFDTNYEKFQSVVSDDDNKESKSYSAVIKWINDYKKNNQSFKPFKIITNPNSYLYKSKKELKVIGLRKDGKFVYEENNKKHQLSSYDEDEYILYKKENEELLDQLDISINESLEIAKQYKKEQEEIKSKLKIVTLNDFRNEIQP